MRSLLVVVVAAALLVPLHGAESTASAKVSSEASNQHVPPSQPPEVVHHFHVAAQQQEPVVEHAPTLKSLDALVAKEMKDLHKLGKPYRAVDEAAIDHDKGKISVAIKALAVQATREQQTEAKARHSRSPDQAKWDENQRLAEDKDHGKIPIDLLKLAQKAEIERNEEDLRRQKELMLEKQPTRTEREGIVRAQSTAQENKNDRMNTLVTLARKAVQERDAEISKGEHQQAVDDAALIHSEENSGQVDAKDNARAGGWAREENYAGQVSKSIIEEARLAMHERDEETKTNANQLAHDQAEAQAEAQAQHSATLIRNTISKPPGNAPVPQK